ncbi:MAG: Ig-like domain-containing protein [Cytophagales bacterium]|nr:Ig-like domain-containing protein [Cytophagales bacterium]
MSISNTTNPANLATNVPLDQVVTVTFNEPMDPATITPGALTVLSPGSPGGRSSATQITGDLTYSCCHVCTMRRLCPTANSHLMLLIREQWPLLLKI